MYTPAALLTAIILYLSIASTVAAPLTGTASNISLRNTTATTPSDYLLNATTLRLPDGLNTTTCQSSLPQQQRFPTPNSLNSISFDVPNTSPRMTLLLFSFGPPIPREEFQFANFEAVATVGSSVRRGNGLKLIAHGLWRHHMLFENVAVVEYSIADHSQLGEGKGINYNELLSVVRGIGFFSLGTSRYEGFTFDVSIAGRNSVGAGHVERQLINDTGDGSECERDQASRGVAVTW